MVTASGDDTQVDLDREWSRAVAREYSVDELEAMCAWLDTNLDLNQQRLESVTTRMSVVLSVGGVSLALMATSVVSKVWPLTAIATIVILLAIVIATVGLRATVRPDRDPSTTWSTLWETRIDGEVLAVLYRRRSVLFQDQRRVIDDRAAALKSSSWAVGFGAILSGAAILVSRLA